MTLTKNHGTAGFDQSSVSTTAAFAASGGSGSFGCSYGPQPLGAAVAPTTTGSTGSANADAYWLEKQADGTLVITDGYLANGGDLAFDPGYGQNGDYVSIMGAYGTGPIKFSELDSNGIPVDQYGVYDNLKTLAIAGTGPLSDGFSVTGISSPVMQQAAFGPVSEELAVAATFMEASKDGGQTFALAGIPGTGPGAATPVDVLDAAGRLDIVFRQATGRAPGIYCLHGSGGVWSALQRLSTSADDMLPTIVATGKTPRIEIAF